MNVKLTEEHKIKIINAKALYKVMRQILLRENEIDINKEHFWVCGLATNAKLLYIELVSLGTLSQSIVEPMDIYSWALHKQVAMIILVHNHPSGELAVSPTDRDLTDRLIQVGKIVRIQVVDHLIISPDGFYSFDKEGLMKRLNKSKKYVPGYMEVERIKAEAQKIGEKIGIEKGRKEGEKIGMGKGIERRNKEIAKQLKEEGIDIEIIVKSTGLSKEKIEKLK